MFSNRTLVICQGHAGLRSEYSGKHLRLVHRSRSDAAVRVLI